MIDPELQRRWRLILGRDAEDSHAANGPALTDGAPGGAQGGAQGGVLGPEDAERDRLLDYLYRRERGGRGEVGEDEEGEALPETAQSGGIAAPDPQLLSWLDDTRLHFPAAAQEVLQAHALDRYGLTGILSDPATLACIQPSLELATVLLRLKSAAAPEVLPAIRRIVASAVEALARRLRERVRDRLGRRDRTASSALRARRNFDLAGTVARNLRHWDPERRRLAVQRLRFFARQRPGLPRRLILCVDQSGSMMGSVLHAAVLAGIMAGLPGVDVRLVLFSTDIADMSRHISDPVELLLSVFLSGGTDIGRAVEYCETLIDNPHRTVFVLITDFYEGGDPARLLAALGRIGAGGTVQLGLPVLQSGATEGSYNRALAARAVERGMAVAVVTPEAAAEWLAERLQ